MSLERKNSCGQIGWETWGYVISCVPYCRSFFQPAQLLGVSPQTAMPPACLTIILSQDPFRLGPRALGKTDSNANSPLPSACCVLGTVPSGLSVIAHVISPWPPSMRWALFYCVHFIKGSLRWRLSLAYPGPHLFQGELGFELRFIGCCPCRAAACCTRPMPQTPLPIQTLLQTGHLQSGGPRVNEGCSRA